jgi:O-antigen/teichoic acid export membrane protein
MATLAPSRIKALFVGNVASSMGARVLYLATRLMLPAMILQHVTLAEFGIWAICFVLIGNIGMSAFGLAAAYVRDTSECLANGNLERLSRTFSTGLTMVGLAAMAFLPLFWLALPSIIGLFHIDAALATTARILIFGTVTVFMLDLSLGSFVYLLQGLQRIRLENAVWVSAFMLEAALIATFMSLDYGIESLLVAFAVRYAFSSLTYFILARRLVPGLRIDPRLFNRESLRLFTGFGFIVQLSGMLSMLNRSIERLLAGVLIGVQATAVFEIGEKFPTTIPSIPSAINAASYPTFAYLHTQGRRDEIAALYLSSARYVSLLAGAAMGFLAAFAPTLLAAWLGPDHVPADAAFILVLFTLPYQLDVLTGPGSAMFKGTGVPRREMVYPIVQLLLVAASVPSLLATGMDTLHAIAWGVAASMSVSALIYIGYATRTLAVPLRRYAVEVLLPGVVPYAIGIAVAALVRAAGSHVPVTRLEHLGALAAGGVVYGVAAIACFGFVLMNAAEQRHVGAFIARSLALVRRKPA